MVKFNNSKLTTNAIFYNRGVPSSEKNFGALVAINYNTVKQLYLYNKNNQRVSSRDFYKLY